MLMLKCKMCGGDLEILPGVSVCECQYCGSKQTLPKLSDEKKQNLYDRANHFRRNNEYDKAMSIYEQILNEDTEDAESYWSLVLCRYGIEYVEDPATRRRVPTVNRAQMTSVFADENYKSALKYADAQQRAIYEAEAREIEQIQKGILAISSKEEPFDIFICYKETDAAGRRTQDSVLANDLYHQLTQEGFKVFFSRITLEDKLGSAYEPYIFAALNSAKVMVVLGTRPDYFNAVWVKNEWSRFLALIKSGAQKTLIPAYRDMDPYDLPEEFSHLQAQDMSKLGFMQDLIRGIKKITGQNLQAENVRMTESMPVSGNGAQALVERAFLFLEDGDFARADELCEQALNQDPKNAQAYVGKLMVERKIRKQESLAEGTLVLTENNYFQKAIRFAEEGLKSELERCNQMIVDRNKDITYERALKVIQEGNFKGAYEEAIRVLDEAIGTFESLIGWRDSQEKIVECQEKKSAIKSDLYQKVKAQCEQVADYEAILRGDLGDTAKIKEAYTDAICLMNVAIGTYQKLDGWEDSATQITDCEEKKNQIKGMLYQGVQALLQSKEAKTGKQSKVLENAVQYLQLLGDYENSMNMLAFNKERIRKQKVKKIVKCVLSIVLLIVLITLVAIIIGRELNKPKLETSMPSTLATSGQSSSNEMDLPDGLVIRKLYGGGLRIEAEDYAKGAGSSLEFVEIPEGVTEIGDRAFCKYSSLKSIKLPSSVKKIEEYAFFCCSSLESIEIPSGVTEIEYCVFSECNSLETIEIPDSVETIESDAFSGCSNLKSVKLPDGVSYIGQAAFYGCSSLETIEIPDGVTAMERGVFSDCSSLVSIKLPESLETIWDGVFVNCSSLETIEIPDNVTEIGGWAFSGCSNLKSVKLSDNVTAIFEGTFAECNNLVSIEIPDSVTYIGHGAFEGCSSLESIKLSYNVTGIDGSAFANCVSMKSIELPESVTVIGSEAFECCSSLESIEIPDGVTEIYEDTFQYCSGLESIKLPDGVTYISNNAFGSCSSLKTFYVKQNSYAESWAISNGYQVVYY